MTHLTEESLGILLKAVFTQYDIIHNKKVCTDIKYRPDYRIEELKLIYEFNGYQHYTSFERILKDSDKSFKLEQKGYKFIEIPYFIQITENVCLNLLQLTTSQIELIPCDIINSYPHGFIHKDACNPFDFCIEGYNRYYNDLAYMNDHNMKDEASAVHESYLSNMKRIKESLNSP